MKTIVVLVILAVLAFFAMYFARSSIDESFDPTEQGKEARAAVTVGASWTEVVDGAGEPRKWKEGPNNFDFDFMFDFEWDADTREEIRERLAQQELRVGFSFLYRFSDAATFAVNFDSQGKVLNIQDSDMSKAELLDEGE